MNVLATGVSGTIGRQLRSRVGELSLRLDEVSDQLTLDLNGVAVIHLAGIVGEPRVKANLRQSRRVNILGTRNLAHAVARSSAKKFVYVSTSHVYELPTNLGRLSENEPVLPRGHYALQKLLGEEMVTDAFLNFPERLVIARVFSVLDSLQPPGTLGHSITQLTSDTTRTLACSDDERDFLSPKIIANVLLQLAETAEANGIYNVCSGVATSVRDAARLVLGESTYERVADRIRPGHSTSPRIVGNPRRLVDALDIDASELHRQFVSELRPQ